MKLRNDEAGGTKLEIPVLVGVGFALAFMVGAFTSRYISGESGWSMIIVGGISVLLVAALMGGAVAVAFLRRSSLAQSRSWLLD